MTSCGDDDNGLEISIESPTGSGAFTAGDLMAIQGTITDDVNVSSVSISAQGAFELSFDLPQATDRTTFRFDETLPIDSIANKGTYQLVVSATDNEGNNETASVDFTVE